MERERYPLLLDVVNTAEVTSQVAAGGLGRGCEMKELAVQLYEVCTAR
jgi:hypothetical protein